MLCYIYRSTKKADTYLYLLLKDDFSVLPEGLIESFGMPEFSFSFDLSTQKKLAKEDAAKALENLNTQGFHLQLADDMSIEQMLTVKSMN